jgi:UDP-2-acetamido-3-amino-2,3-dideoxy-glucuronate N-acetyltransferase
MIASDVKLAANVVIFDSNLSNLYGCEIGRESRIGPFVEIQKRAKIGKRCKISSHSFICSDVTIEDNVFIGHGVMFTNDVYPRSINKNGEIRKEEEWQKNFKQILIKKGASIGSGSVILPGIIIGEDSIVGAGSVVTHNVPQKTIVAGNPARVLRKIKDE